jgi:hypothetical protein
MDSFNLTRTGSITANGVGPNFLNQRRVKKRGFQIGVLELRCQYLGPGKRLVKSSLGLPDVA